MKRYVASRIFQGFFTLVIATIFIFLLIRLTGDPLDVLVSDYGSAEDYRVMAEHLGLDKSLPEQYWIFFSNIFKGDLGTSLRYRTPVTELIKLRLPVTLKLAFSAALFSIFIAVPLGIFSAVRRNEWPDLFVKIFAMLGQSIATFWLGIVLIQIFVVHLGWLPVGGHRGILYWILPAVTLGWRSTAGVTRLTRSGMLECLESDFIRTARIKGVNERIVIWKHALKNALIPVLTFSGVIFTRFLMGSVVVETVFAWPGVGRQAYEAVKYRDFPLIQGLTLLFVGFYIFFNLAIDILYVFVDPRITFD